MKQVCDLDSAVFNYPILAPSSPEHPMTIKPVLAAVFMFLLGACAQVPVTPTPQPAAAQAQPTPPQAADEPEQEAPVAPQPMVTAPKGPELPNVELTDRIIFDLLLAEISAQRGNVGL